MKPVLILHGPNMNLLGERETEIYGDKDLNAVDQKLIKEGADLGFEIRRRQSNHEGELITALHEARKWAEGIVFNPGGYTHTSIALRQPRRVYAYVYCLARRRCRNRFASG
jgi:3-dehydroquinate dehydratase-2